MKICPVSPQCLHTYLLEPFLEGVERVNLAWQGVRFHQVAEMPPKIDLKERLILLVVGAVLLLPFINNVVWAFWQVFGTPEKLSDPYAPETNSPPPVAPAPRNRHARRATLVDLPPLPSPPERREIETFVFSEDHPDEKGKKIEVTTQFQRDGVFTRIIQDSDVEHSESVYESNGLITRYQYQKGNIQFSISLHDENLKTTLTGKNDKTFKLESGYRWIQQPMFGFRNFLASNEEKILVYCLLPNHPISSRMEVPLLIRASATKKGREVLPDIGDVLKVEVAPTELPYSLGRAAILYFDPETHILKKFIEPGMPGTAEKGGVLLRHRRSPAQERPESPAR